ncbi:hypothetical protein R1T16_15885 [Flavobacterium sp. DG1-102-2]|uniref:hypothetical protein n=1 Tax=Flavobacterium sp. DG1-102-2 TaxID=3081663 RepID=UPI00294A177A|nr:hypothetical protein [Flavobacterium sp. DG1-102-2]MDV6169918.1 hypothetical protein [Flavobacterium sp. DG1-102-2]
MIKNTLYHIITAFCLLTVLSCAKEKETKEQEAAETTEQKKAQETKEEKAYDFSKFAIGKAKLGPVKIGMTIAKAETYLTDFTQQDAEALDFGFDGGGKAFIYNYKGKPVLALVPALNSDVIIGIAAIDKNLQTFLYTHPKMAIKDMLPVYPNVKVQLNQMMEWEEIFDDVNGWNYVFMTNDKNRVGAYKNESEATLPARLTAQSDWITIRKPASKNDCTLLHSGTFTYKDSEGDDVLVKINDKVWTEEHKGGKYVTLAQMKWVSKCEYENTLIMSSIPGFKLEPGTVMNVTIDKIKGFDIYFTATAEGNSYHGILTKI